VLPDSLLLQAPEEVLDHFILLRRVRRDEPLPQSIVPAGASESAALEDEPIVTPENRRQPVRACAASGSIPQPPSPPRLIFAGAFGDNRVTDRRVVGSARSSPGLTSA